MLIQPALSIILHRRLDLQAGHLAKAADYQTLDLDQKIEGEIRVCSFA
jgi:hypothetical protein